MTYTIYILDDYLKPIANNISKDDLKNYGEIKKDIYDAYDIENAKVVGYILVTDLYALKESKK